MNRNDIFKQRIQDLKEETNNEQLNEEDYMAKQQTKPSSQNVYTSDTPPSQRVNADTDWFDDDDAESYEGQLAVDVFQDAKNIYIKTAIAGINPENIEVHLNNDMLTIRGKRDECEQINEDQYFIQECYWGGFSRSIILPVDVKQDQVKANIENGILTVALPKSKRPRNTRIKVIEAKA